MPIDKESTTFGYQSNPRADWEEFKAKVEARLAEGFEIHAAMLIVGFDDDKGKDQGAHILVCGCPTCLVPNVLKHLREFCDQVNETESTSKYH